MNQQLREDFREFDEDLVRARDSLYLRLGRAINKDRTVQILTALPLTAEILNFIAGVEEYLGIPRMVHLAFAAAFFAGTLAYTAFRSNSDALHRQLGAIEELTRSTRIMAQRIDSGVATDDEVRRFLDVNRPAIPHLPGQPLLRLPPPGGL